MPDRKDETRVLEGEVTETPSSDAAISRELEQQKKEYFALTGRSLTVKPVSAVSPSETQVLKPGSFGVQSSPVEDVLAPELPGTAPVRVESLSHIHSKMALRIQKRREERQALKKAA